MSAPSDNPAPRPADLSGTAYPTKAMREWMEKMKQEASQKAVDPALVDEGFWIVRFKDGRVSVVQVDAHGYADFIGNDYGEKLSDIAKGPPDAIVFLRKLDLEKLIGE